MSEWVPAVLLTLHLFVAAVALTSGVMVERVRERVLYLLLAALSALTIGFVREHLACASEPSSPPLPSGVEQSRAVCLAGHGLPVSDGPTLVRCLAPEAVRWSQGP